MQDPRTAARELRTVILENRDQTEAERRLAPPIVKGLIDTGLCRLALPADLGGHESHPVVALEVYEELASAEASVAWIAWNNQLVCFFARFMNEVTRGEVFGDRELIYANSTRPQGKVVVDNGNYLLSGQWALVSGCELAEWIPLMGIVEENGEVQMMAPGVPNMRMGFVKKGSFEILDTWHVGGLRGTGSHDVVVKDASVPADKTVFFMDPVVLDLPIARLPIGCGMSAGCAAVALGIAQGAATACIELGREKVSPDPTPDLRDRPANQATIATQTSALGAARRQLHASMEALWEQCEQGTPIDPMLLAQAWSANINAAMVARTVVTEMYRVAGTTALYVDSPIERAHRDIHAVLQHIVLQPLWLEEAGRVMLGLEPTSPLFSI